MNKTLKSVALCSGEENCVLVHAWSSIAALLEHKKHKLAKIVATAGYHSLTHMINPTQCS